MESFDGTAGMLHKDWAIWNLNYSSEFRLEKHGNWTEMRTEREHLYHPERQLHSNFLGHKLTLNRGSIEMHPCQLIYLCDSFE